MSTTRTADPEALVTLASTAARAGAAYIRTHRPSGRVEVAATKSSPTDPVTEIDRATERVIREHVLAARPDDGFLGEEGGLEEGTSGVVWVVDPIDGTVNFVYGIPAYAVSIAAQVDGVVQAACVLDVVRGEEFTAMRGQGALLRESPARGAVHLQAVAPPTAGSALVATGFNYVLGVRRRQAAAVARLLESVRDVRRTGSAALDLCALAAGRLDAYVEEGLQPWDLAAGGLIAEEAGVALAGLENGPDERLTMAAPAAFAGEFFAIVRACGF